MNTTTIYRINEQERTIELAQSVIDTDENIHSAVLNTRTFTFDELLVQHKVFCEHTEPYETFKDRLNSALRIDRSIDISTDDMIARFVAEYGENIFFRGFVCSVIEFYDKERNVLLKPNDVVIAKLNRKKIQDEISHKLMGYMDTQLALIRNDAYFSYKASMEHFMIKSARTMIAVDDYTWSVFRESDNCLLTILAEIGQLVHHNRWTACNCGFCNKLFLGTENEVCCHSHACIDAQKQQKEAIYKENTKEYSFIKRDYDAFVRRYKKELIDAGIEKYHPAEFDEFTQEKQVRMEDMDKLKKRLIRNGLPTKELENLSAKYKAEMKAIADELIERFGKKI